MKIYFVLLLLLEIFAIGWVAAKNGEEKPLPARTYDITLRLLGVAIQAPVYYCAGQYIFNS